MRKRIKVLIIISVLLLIILVGWLVIKKVKEKNKNPVVEYQPEEEISEEQERETMISLYFLNKETKKLEPEARLIDVKELVKEPYKTLLNLLIEGPKNEKLEKLIPDGTVVNKVEINNDTLVIDFSADFVNNQKEGKENEEQTINSIVNTLTELTEINSIKILINGEADKSFKDKEISFANSFIRQD